VFLVKEATFSLNGSSYKGIMKNFPKKRRGKGKLGVGKVTKGKVRGENKEREEGRCRDGRWVGERERAKRKCDREGLCCKE
jgi:hypothetical protein